MISKLYVGNLAYSVTDESLNQHFAEFGGVNSAKVMMDRDTGRSKGFGFVEMESPMAAQSAIRGMHGKTIDGRALTVAAVVAVATDNTRRRAAEARRPTFTGPSGPVFMGGPFGFRCHRSLL